MSVLEYAARQIKSFPGNPLTIKALVNEARTRAPHLSLFHDEHYRRACLVVPERLEALAGALDVSWDVAAGSTGLLDALAFGQLTVAADRAVEEVVRLAKAADAAVVLVVDDLAKPLGIFQPGRYVELKGSTIVAASGGSGLSEGEIRDRLSAAIVDPYVCARCGTVSDCPCGRNHPPAPCGRRKLS